MSIKPSPFFLFVAATSLALAALQFAFSRPALAHPVAQGSMDIIVYPDRVVLRARVTMEEILVPSALQATGKSASLSEACNNYGQYLPRHLFLSANKTLLSGKLIKVTEPAASGPQSNFAMFEYEYANPAGMIAPTEIELKQNVLNEFTYAPGNVWEASYVVRIGTHDGDPREGLLLTSRNPIQFKCDWNTPATAAPASIDRWQVFTEYVWHGFMHIITGYDHLLFISALVLATRGFWDLFKVVSAFTLSHSLTLTLSALDVVRLPSAIVEPIIAASIVFVAVENIMWPERSRGWSRLIAAFLFGLFHGLGFAGGLLEAMEGMRGGVIALAIFAFSLGVEIGHQTVVLPLFAALRMRRGKSVPDVAPEKTPDLTLRYGSLIISVAGLFYFVAALRQ